MADLYVIECTKIGPFRVKWNLYSTHGYASMREAKAACNSLNHDQLPGSKIVFRVSLYRRRARAALSRSEKP
jgi:hypothetical protein